MFDKQIKANIKYLDVKIGGLLLQLSDENLKLEDYYAIKEKIDGLVKVRSELAENVTKGSIKPIVASGVVQMISIVTVLQFEKTDVITSKVFGMATKMFKGSV